jgi:hypothetical protein
MRYISEGKAQGAVVLTGAKRPASHPAGCVPSSSCSPCGPADCPPPHVHKGSTPLSPAPLAILATGVSMIGCPLPPPPLQILCGAYYFRGREAAHEYLAGGDLWAGV